MTDPQQRQADALAYLAGELGPRAPRALDPVGVFDEQPLAGEGAVSLFAFELAAASGAGVPDHDPRHFVVVGETSPNYFPAYGLSADDAYSLHIGTRFMLGMEIGRLASSEEPRGAREALRAFVRLCNPDVPIEDLELAALFGCAGERYGVYAVRLAGRRVYCFGADCPPGFSELGQHPPQVALRLHLGRLIRREARDDARHNPGGARGA